MTSKKIFFACNGLGTTRRGYEMFFASLFEKLRHRDDLHIYLFKGGGKSSRRERRLWNLPRRSKLAQWLGNRLQVGNASLGRGYYIEQATFFISLLPYLIWHRPAVVYFSDKNLGDLLFRWKKRTGQRMTLVFRNGGPYPPPYPLYDMVQQLTEPLYREALNHGCPAAQQHLLPAGFDISPHFEPLSPVTKLQEKQALGLPVDRPVVLCVSAINSSHKRIDYVIQEIAKLQCPRPYLKVLGQPDNETPAILAQAQELLGSEDFSFDNVDSDRLQRFYQCADVFVLGSVREGFGRVMVEAMAWGLPCLVHDYDVARYVLGEHGYYGDFREPGVLAELLETLLGQSQTAQTDRHASVYHRFSWDQLLPAYLDMLDQAVTQRD